MMRTHGAMGAFGSPGEQAMTPDEAAAFIAEVEAGGERRQVPCAGHTVTWRRFGSGRPLVLLHGGHGSWLHWIKNIRCLATSHTVWVPDMPGFGDSAAAGASIATMGELLTAMRLMLDDLFRDDGQIDLAGFSFGGLVAANIASHCDRIRKLALLGSAGHGGVRRQTVELLNWRRCRDGAELHAVMRRNLAAHMLADPAAIDGLALEAHIRSCRQARFRSKGVSRSWRLADALDHVAIPTLMAWGEHDVTADPAAVIPVLTEGHPNRHGLIVPKRGHWLQFEGDAEINACLTDWFADAA